MKTLVGIMLCVLAFSVILVGWLFTSWLMPIGVVIGFIGGWTLAGGRDDV